MRNHHVLAAAVLLVAGASLAYSELIETVQSDLEKGPTGFSVTNNSQQRMTAIIVTAMHIDVSGKWLSTGTRWMDSVLHRGPRFPLMPMDSLGFREDPHSREARAEFAVRAAAFADGTTYGEPEWIEGLLKRRAAAHRYFGIVMQRLSLAKTAEPPEAVLLDELQQLEKRLRSEIDLLHHDVHSPTPRSSKLDDVFGVVTANLSQQSRVGETWPERIRRVEYLCRSMRRDLEMARPHFVPDDTP